MTRTPPSRSKGQLAGGGSYCGGLPHSLLNVAMDNVDIAVSDSIPSFAEHVFFKFCTDNILERVNWKSATSRRCPDVVESGLVG